MSEEDGTTEEWYPVAVVGSFPLPLLHSIRMTAPGCTKSRKAQLNILIGLDLNLSSPV